MSPFSIRKSLAYRMIKVSKIIPKKTNAKYGLEYLKAVHAVEALTFMSILIFVTSRSAPAVEATKA